MPYDVSVVFEQKVWRALVPLALTSQAQSSSQVVASNLFCYLVLLFNDLKLDGDSNSSKRMSLRVRVQSQLRIRGRTICSAQGKAV